jgi:hypothetical protein
MAVSRAERSAARRDRVVAMFGEAQAEVAQDLLELTEFAGDRDARYLPVRDPTPGPEREVRRRMPSHRRSVSASRPRCGTRAGDLSRWHAVVAYAAEREGHRRAKPACGGSVPRLLKSTGDSCL